MPCSSPRPAPARPRWCRSPCSASAWRGDGRIVMLEPRRLATRAAATRMAALLGEPVGQHRRLSAPGSTPPVSAATRIEVRHRGPAGPPPAIRSRPGRRRRVILDEIHERVAGGRPRAGLLPRPAAHAAAGTAPAGDVGHRRRRAPRRRCWTPRSIESAGRMHPGRDAATPTRDIAAPRDLPDALARAVRAALAEHAGDMLAFLPGMARNPPRPGRAGRLRRAGAAAARRPAAGRAGPRPAPGRGGGAWCWRPRSPRPR